MNEYELLYIVPTQYTDEEVLGVQKNIGAFIVKHGGNVVSEKNLGKIRLAYPIKKVSHGTYMLSYFDCDPATVKDLDRELTLHDEVLRHTIITRPDGALERTFELSSYVAPLSEEAKLQRRDAPRPGATRHAPVHVAPAMIEETTMLAPLKPSGTSAAESTMSMEELDKKIDELLDVEIT